MSKLNESVNLIIRSLRRFISLSFILAVMILMVRLFELIFVSNYYNYPPGSFFVLLGGLKFDIILYLRISAFLLIPFLIIAFFSQKAARIFFISVSVLLILGDMLLLKYFSTSRVPLGVDLFGYSIAEIQHTVQSSGELKILPFVFMALFLIYMVRVFKKHVYFKLKPWMMAPITFIMFISLLPLKFFEPQPSRFNNEFSMFAATNKLFFFGESVLNHYLNKEKINEQVYEFKTVTASDNSSFNYLDKEYPFLHTESTPDVLGEYFELGDTSPNIVLIVVESLGRAYSGEGAYLGSFTPFLDSLMNKSLYWENCLSTSGRTFQVLPSTLASVPFGENGFAEMGENMPDHISLISLLKKEGGYESSFVYGGNAEFDNMNIFLKRQGIDKIIDEKEFDAGYEKLPATSKGFTWGYGDKDVFRRYINELKVNTGRPRMDVMLTMAMHDPFNIPNQEYYLKRFNERINELNLSDKTHTFNHGYDKQFSSILYFDESLKYFFDEMQKLPTFSNTIFIITGDHRMPEIPISTQLDRFHVPLVIYSPMLKETKKFSSVVTHFDITPSIVALLDGQKIISRPKVAAWVGHGLDNYESFRCLNAYPLMRNKNEILDYVDSERMLANNIVYQIYDNMDIEPENKATLQPDLKAELNNFISMNYYACKNNKLIPDSLKKYTVFNP
ncbi:MAG: LTA synthase family protein [Draconibacterium sp.]